MVCQMAGAGAPIIGVRFNGDGSATLVSDTTRTNSGDNNITSTDDDEEDEEVPPVDTFVCDGCGDEIKNEADVYACELVCNCSCLCVRCVVYCTHCDRLMCIACSESSGKEGECGSCRD